MTPQTFSGANCVFCPREDKQPVGKTHMHCTRCGQDMCGAHSNWVDSQEAFFCPDCLPVVNPLPPVPTRKSQAEIQSELRRYDRERYGILAVVITVTLVIAILMDLFINNGHYIQIIRSLFGI